MVDHARRRLATPRAFALAALMGLLSPARAPLAAPESPAAEPPASMAGADQILVDVVVTDKQGHPVKGLTVDDFELREDGVPQVLTSVDAVDLAPALAAVPREPVSAAAPRWSANDGAHESPQRVFLLVMDDDGLSLASATDAQRAARQFLLDATRPGDLVSLVVPGVGVTWSTTLPEGRGQLVSAVDAVKGRADLSTERASIWDALIAARSGAPQVRVVAQELLEEDRRRRRELFENLLAALDGVASIRGRKVVLLFSEGFVREPDDQPFRDLVAAMSRNDAVLYFVDVKRLTSGLSWRRANPQDFAGAEVLARETGGLTVRDLDAGLARITQESSSYYILGYSPKIQGADGGYRRVEVDVRRADLTARARTGYSRDSRGESPFPSGAEAKLGAHRDVERVLAEATLATEIPLRLAAFTQQPIDKGKVRVRLVAEVGLQPLRFEDDGNGLSVATLDWTMALNHVEAAGRQLVPWREWKLKVPLQAEELAIWASLDVSFDVPAGACQAKLVVRDRRSGALGSVRYSFDVPEPGRWRVSTPILSELPGQENGSPPLVLANRSFVVDTPLYCYLEVYDGVEKKAVDAPRVSLAYTLVDDRGETRRSVTASPFTLNASGILARLETIPLTGLSPGEYELRLAVTDEVSGRAQEIREAFAVRRPSRPSLAMYRELLHAFLAGEVGRASSGVMEWRPEDLEKLAVSLPSEEGDLRRAALLLHTGLALQLWSHNRGADAEAQITICRAVLGDGSRPDLRRDWLLALGYYRLAAGLPDSALKALPFFEECARLFPESPEAWLRAGTCYETAAFPDGLDFGELPTHKAAERAERCFRRAVELDPSLAEARLRLGRVLSRAGKLDEAETELAAAVEASTEGPLTAQAHIFWGALRDDRGDLAAAVRHYRAALAAAPESQTAAFALGEALFRSGHQRSAGETLLSVLPASRATDISPWQAYHLGFRRQNWVLDELLQPPPGPHPVATGERPSGTP